MHLENLFSAFFIRPVHEDVTIEPSRPEQRGIQNLGPVCGRHQDDAHIWVETVHLHQELVEGLFPFIMTPHGSEASGFSQGIQFIDENDAGRLLFGLHKKVPHPSRTETHEHLHKLRSAQAEERHAALSCNRLGQKSLPGSRWTYEQDPFWHFAAQFRKLRGLLEEFNHLHQFLFGFIHTGRVFKGDVQLILHVDFGLVFAQGHKAGLLAGHTFHEEIPDADEEKDGKEPRENIPKKSGLHLAFEGDPVLLKETRDLRVHPDRLEPLSLGRIRRILEQFALDLVGSDSHLGHPLCF